MATSDKIEFHEPIHVGELVELVARVERVGRSSMTVAVDMIREDLISGRRKSAVRGTFEMVAVNEFGRPVPIIASDNQSDQRGSCVLKQHSVRTFKSADQLARADQLAWKIAEVAADPVAVESDVAEMIGNRMIDNAAVAAASVARRPVVNARAQAEAHPFRPGATVFGLTRHSAISPEWAAWANGVAVRELDFHDTFLAADYSHPGDNIPPLLAVAPALRTVGRGPHSWAGRRL